MDIPSPDRNEFRPSATGRREVFELEVMTNLFSLRTDQHNIARITYTIARERASGKFRRIYGIVS